jgi:hypothetical protein
MTFIPSSSSKSDDTISPDNALGKKVVLFVGLILAIINAATFWDHYLGTMTFPWDFLGGYHAQSFGWYRDGSLFNPPAWFPWGNIGFPAALAVQAGGWYIPLGILDGLNIPYTVHVATAFQAFHVFLGALGTYFFLRALKIDWPVALLGAISFHFSAGFYSNQQHVDILRAHALLPWLLWSIHPGVILQSRFRPAVAAVILFQLLVASYPGNIVSAAYTCFIFCSIQLWSIKKTGKQRVFIVSLLAAVASGVMMSALKWWPFLAMHDLLKISQVNINPIYPHQLITLFFPYDREFLVSDITMRSFFLPATVLFSIVFLNHKDLLFRTAISIIVISTVLGGVIPMLSPSNAFLPGLNISRFPVSDWRPSLQLGLIMLASSGWRGFLRKDMDQGLISLRIGRGLILMSLVSWIALDIGYQVSDLRRPMGFIIAIAVTTKLFSLSKSNKRLTLVGLTILALLTILDGFTFHREQGRPWRVNWSRDAELQIFGMTPNSASNTSLVDLSRRPERLVVGETLKSVVVEALNSKYNGCWYSRSYCLLGYNNLKLSVPHTTFFNRLSDPNFGPHLLEFTKRAQQAILLAAEESFDITTLSTTSDAPFITTIPNASMTPISYRPNKITYNLSTPIPLYIVENEMWWQGWQVQLCQKNRCLKPTTTTPTKEYLRSWYAPAGEWRAELTFVQPGAITAKVIFLVGILMPLIYGLFLHRYMNQLPLRALKKLGGI